MKITQPLKKPSPHYGMDTSQQPRDENKITHKNSLFLSWCILLALCFAFVSAAPAAAGSFAQTAPMPGTILDIHVKVGDVVTANQPVMILEAMKMENEVVAEQAGTIASINVEKGAMVNPGDTLFTLA